MSDGKNGGGLLGFREVPAYRAGPLVKKTLVKGEYLVAICRAEYL